MSNKGFTLIELLASIVCLLVLVLIVVGALSKESTPEQQMEDCMYEYEDFEYCKYKLGVE